MTASIHISQKEDAFHVSYIGDIDEEAEVALTNLLSQLSGKCIINLRHVTNINSCGVRAWVNFLRTAQKNCQFHLEECSPEVVMQINMIPSFKGNAEIASVYSRIFCMDCQNIQSHLFSSGSNLPDTPEDEIDSIICEKCQSKNTELEISEDEFFAFLED